MAPPRARLITGADGNTPTATEDPKSRSLENIRANNWGVEKWDYR